jgi:uncharacterized protein (DUF1778 family)
MKNLTHTAKCRIRWIKEFTMPVNQVARLEARLPKAVYATLKRAAELEGRSLSDFVVSAAQDAANRVIENTTIIRLSVADQIAFAEALLNPPKPNAALKRARKLHDENVEMR